MGYTQKINALKVFGQNIGAPTDSLHDLLEYFGDNKDILPSYYRAIYDDVMDGFAKLLG